MSEPTESTTASEGPAGPIHRRRVRYSGKNPRRYEDKYKELQPERYGTDVIQKVRASGKTPAGQHIPILLPEILEVLRLQPGQRVVDVTLGYGGHSAAMLARILPHGQLLGLDQDPVEIVQTKARLRRQVEAASAPPECLLVQRMNFAGVLKALSQIAWTDGTDALLADLGCSSMQFDQPSRGFSFKHDGPLDMRMNPGRGVTAREWLRRVSPERLARALEDFADEPQAEVLAAALAGQDMETTLLLSRAVDQALPPELDDEARDLTVRRVFQAIRISVNEEMTALDTLLRSLPAALRPGGRVAILTFHSGEDRRVKHALRDGLRDGTYAETNAEVIRPSADERRDNPRSSSAKLRWAIRAF